MYMGIKPGIGILGGHIETGDRILRYRYQSSVLEKARSNILENKKNFITVF